jgi:hypothetical protein
LIIVLQSIGGIKILSDVGISDAIFLIQFFTVNIAMNIKTKQIICLTIILSALFVSNDQHVYALTQAENSYFQHQHVISNSHAVNQTNKYHQRSVMGQPSPAGCSSSQKYYNCGGFWHPFLKDQQHLNAQILIVAGGGKTPHNTLWSTTEFLANQFYRLLIRSYYHHDQIMYISDHSYDYDDDGDGSPEIIVDDHDPTVDDIRRYIENLSSDNISMLNENDWLIIYLNDHGGQGKIKINTGEYLDAEILDQWLDQLQEYTNCQVVVIAEACHSGTFIDFLSPDDNQQRVLISSSNTELSHYEDNGKVSFSKYLFDYIIKGKDLQASFYYARYQMNQNMFFHQQTPLLIDGHNEEYAARFKIGVSSSDSFPEIIDSTSNCIIDTGMLSVFVKASDLEGSIDVWAKIIKPNISIPTTTIDFQTPIIDSEKIPIVQTDEQNVYAGTYDFQCNGTYLLTFFAKDQITNIVSKEIQIHVQNGIDCLADINNDLTINLMDAISVLELCSHMDTNYTLTVLSNDVNKDGYLGLAEVIYILQKISGL